MDWSKEIVEEASMEDWDSEAVKRGVVIRKESNKIIFVNPGYVRTGKNRCA